MPNSNRPRVIMDVPERFAVGVKTDFSVSFTPGDQAGTMVQGAATFPAGDYTAWYYEPNDGNWYEFQGSSDSTTESIFGGASGFPLQDATSYFRVRFDSEMTGTFVVRIKVAGTESTYLAQAETVVRAVAGETIDELNTRVATARDGEVVKLDTDVVGTLSIANTVTIDGQGHTLHGNVVLDATSSTTAYDVTLSNLRIADEDGEATSAKSFGIVGQNQSADTPVRPVNLVLRDCAIGYHPDKAIYITNAKSLNVVACRIGDGMGTEGYADYAIDVNLCGVKNSAIRIVDNTFLEMCSSVGAIKIAQRGGIVNGSSLTDDVNDDILNPVSATVASCVIAGNDFSAINGDGAIASGAVDYTYSGYTYTGAISASGSTISAVYDSTLTDLVSDPTDVVNDLDYLLGALYRGAGVTAIEWNGTAYTWSGSRAASNWVNGSNQLTSDIVSWVLANIQSIRSPSISMKVTSSDGTVSTLTIAIGLGSASEGSTASASANVIIGSAANSDGTARTYCEAFPVSITGADGGATVLLRGADGGSLSFELGSGDTFTASATANDDGTYTITVRTSDGVTVSGTAGDSIVVVSRIAWELPDKGPVGAGFNGLRRFILKAESVEYPAGGFEVPERFYPEAILEASADGGIMSWYDAENRRIVLYTAHGVEASGTLEKVTIVLIGR